MEICGVIIILVIMFRAAKMWDRKHFLIILAGTVMCFAAALLNETGNSEKNIEYLKKSEVGTGSEAKELVAEVGNEESKTEESTYELLSDEDFEDINNF